MARKGSAVSAPWLFWTACHCAKQENMEMNARFGLCVCVVAFASLMLASCAVPDQERQQVKNSNLFLNAKVPITVTITEVEGSLDNIGASDFFAEVHINNGDEQDFGPIEGDDHIRPPQLERQGRCPGRAG